MTVSDQTQGFHDHHIMVNRQVELFKHRRNFELSRSYFIVTGLGGNAQTPQFLVYFAHERQNTRFDRAEIVIFQLLMLGRHFAEQGTSALDQVGATKIKTLVNQEIFLLDTHGGKRTGGAFFAEAGQQTIGLFADCLDRTQQRSLFIQRFAGIGAESSRDAKGGTVFIALDECRAGGIPGGIAAGFEGGTEAAGREAGSIRFALDQAFAGEIHRYAAIVIGFNERVVFFRGGAGKRLEPVGVVSGTLADCPALHGVGYVVGNFGVETFAILDSGQ